jgi:hypothetical protein
MRILLETIAIVGFASAASAAQAVPLFYDEAESGDIFARIGNIPVFDLGIGDNVIAGTQFFSGPDFAIADADLFSFVVPDNSVLSFVTVEFGDFDFTEALVGFGPNYAIARGPLTGPTQFVDNSRTAANPFTNVLTSVGPQNLFTRLPVGSGLYSWIDGLGSNANDDVDLDRTSAKWEYRLTFGVDRIAVPEPAPLALLGFGLFMLYLRRRGTAPSMHQLKGASEVEHGHQANDSPQ